MEIEVVRRFMVIEDEIPAHAVRHGHGDMAVAGKQVKGVKGKPERKRWNGDDSGAFPHGGKDATDHFPV